MFFKVKGVNYFVVPDEKSAQEIYDEIFTRMNSSFISSKEKRKLVYQIKKQLKKEYYELHKVE